MTDRQETAAVESPFVFALDPAFYPAFAEAYRENETLLVDLEKAHAEVSRLSDGLQDRLRAEVVMKPCRAAIEAYLAFSSSGAKPGDPESEREALQSLRRYARFFREIKAQIGCAGKPVNQRTRDDLKTVFDDYVSMIQPVAVLGRYRCRFEEDRVHVDGVKQPISSRNLYRFYTTAWKRSEEEEYATYDSEQEAAGGPPTDCFLFAATIGPGVDREVRRLSDEGDNYRALLLNGIGAGAADMVAMDLELSLNHRYPSPGKRWRRFHVGYADFKLEEQRVFFDLLRPERIDIALTESCIMIPEKSVSGIVAMKQVRKEGGGP